MRLFTRRRMVAALTLMALCAGATTWLIPGHEGELAAQVAAPIRRLDQIPFDGESAYKHLQAIADIGPRASGSQAMLDQQKLVTDHFKELGGKVTRQEFQARHPLTGAAVPMCNLIVEWHPDRKERILLAAHYDTRPFPDNDRANPRGRFVGANDGASGVALLMELGRHMPDFDSKLGVDFVLFDGEELVYQEVGEYFIGSKFFARDYVRNPPAHRYRTGVLLDMVADANLGILLDTNSLRYARETTKGIWDTAARLGVREFVNQVYPVAINDDHMPLNQIARIPTCDVIDFDYPYWHTEGDRADRCSALSLAKVGWVVHEWLKKL